MMNGTILLNEGRLLGRIFCEGSLKGHIGIPTGYVDYKGPYIVEPTFNEQKLHTSDMHMNNDVTVKSIPYSEVDNTSGGFTINIGG